ncbi:hypothetical protein HDU98_003564 [Podochytrium sp. JEL0797]|nr:hypothetical protein HDU98_003564 [Podochytrium sp. JEL0797]
MTSRFPRRFSKLEDEDLPHTSQLQNTFTFVPVSTAESQYLQSTIGKILVAGVTHVLASQCDDPVDALGSYDENKRAFEAEEASRMATKAKAIPQSVQVAQQVAKQEQQQKFQEEVASWNQSPVDLSSIFCAPQPPPPPARVPSTNNLSSTSSSISLADEPNPPSESTDATPKAIQDAPDAVQAQEVDNHAEVAPAAVNGEEEEVSIKELEQDAVLMGDEEEAGVQPETEE